MSVFSDSSYAPPGVYTQTVLSANTAILSGTARVPVFIGEGTEYFTNTNVEMHRGSSATSDDQIVGENLSAQVTGTGRVFQLQHYPVVTGSGSGTVTNDVSKVSIQVDGLPATLISLVGSQGLVTLQDIVPSGSNVTAQYYFKRTDTLISNENISPQIPTSASASFQTITGIVTLGVSTPGTIGNGVTLTFVEGAAASDVDAVSGEGTNSLTINLTKQDSTLRTVADVVNLITAGINTLSAGFLTVVVNNGYSSAIVPATLDFAGGDGPNTNTTFKVAHVPIVDGTNGGVATTDPTKLTFLVNGVPVPISSVNGATGMFTSSVPVAAGSSALLTYYTNTYQNTSDILPATNVASLSEVGYGPNSSNFIQGTDYVLNGNSIAWGASVSTAAASSTAGFTPLDASVINTTLVDEQVFLRPVTGVVNSVNTVFTLSDSPVDGSGLGRATDNPSLVTVYVGADPVSALTAGAVQISQLSGASGTVTLYNPPTTGNFVYASYWRSELADHAITVEVAEAGGPNVGTFTLKDELNRTLPHTSVGSTPSDATPEGIVWPNNFPDFEAPIGAPEETVTLTFQDDSLTHGTPATQASVSIPGGSNPFLTLTASTPGVGGNACTVTCVTGGGGVADADAITVVDNAITINIEGTGGTTRTWVHIGYLFQEYPVTTTDGGLITATASLPVAATALGSTQFTGGAAAVTIPYANRFLVTSSRSNAVAQADGLGQTGGAFTGGSGTGATGYLGQTYIDAHTGVKFTIVDPAKALSYGYTQLPTSYIFVPGDVITLVINPATGFTVGSTPTLAIPGLRTQVVTTLNMNPGDTAVISTFDRAGSEPAVGDYYYVTFTTNKAASDYGLKTFTNVGDAYTLYGQPSVLNRVSLAISLFQQNGGGQFSVVQVQKQAGLGVASDQAYIDAIQSLAVALPGTQKYVNVVTPLSTSATVQQALGQFLSTQSAPRKKAEAIGVIGFGQYTTPAVAQSTATAIANSRVIAIGGAFLVGIMLQPDNISPAVEYAVSGEFVAAALTGLMLNPANDVATTLTGQKVVGFTRLLTTFDAPTMDAMASAGLTVLVDDNGALAVRHYKTTNPANVLTSEPYVQTIADAIAQDFRQIFKQFIGIKEATGVVASIQAVGNAYLKGKNNVWITAYQPLVVTQDPNDPTTINVAVSYVPMFSLLYLNVTFTVNLT